MTPSSSTLVVGAGIYGLTAARELCARGHRVTVIDPGPIPHPLAASTDISKVIRMEYGVDEDYMEMVELSLPVWRDWNDEFGDTLYHETGVTMVTRVPMSPGGFEYESYEVLLKRGHTPDRLDSEELSRRFPAWKRGEYVDGFFHAEGGFAESGKVVSALARRLKEVGCRFEEGVKIDKVDIINNGVTGVRTATGKHIGSDTVVIAAGTWTQLLVPELQRYMRSSGHPVFHLKPSDPELFTPPNFSTFTADIANTGWYGFPLHPGEGVVKIANHGSGREIHPEAPREVTDSEKESLRAMLASTFPALARAPIVFTRRCLYSDTLDENFWIDRHPEIEGLVVAAGGSGHGFKMAPLLGGLIADAVEGKKNRWSAKFRWRALDPGTRGEEAARFHW